MTTAHTFTSPVGRLVGGDVFKYRDKDFDGRPLMTRDNKPRVEYVVLIAFPKSDPATEEMRRKIYAAATEGFPSLFSTGQPPPGFSFKWTDGDSNVPNQRGVKPCEKEGYPGSWVLTFRSSFAPKVYDRNQTPIDDEKAIKRGDWVRVGAVCRGNQSQSKPGVYLNHSMLQLCGYGEEISTGPDASVVFADPIQLPPGASATPVAPSAGMPGVPTPPAVPGAVPAGVPAGVPAPAAVPSAVPAGVPAPAPVPNFGAAPAAPAPAAPAAPAPPTAKQTVPGCPHTYEALVAAGWSEDQMRTAGYLA